MWKYRLAAVVFVTAMMGFAHPASPMDEWKVWHWFATGSDIPPSPSAWKGAFLDRSRCLGAMTVLENRYHKLFYDARATPIVEGKLPNREQLAWGWPDGTYYYRGRVTLSGQVEELRLLIGCALEAPPSPPLGGSE